MKYIQSKTFSDFCTNQEKLVEILNHRMTSVEKHMSSIKTDIKWLKTLIGALVVLGFSIFGTMILKIIFGV